MILDFHTHTFPDSIAPKALASLSGAEHLIPFTDGTNQGLLASMDKAGVTCSVLLPVITKPEQAKKVNQAVIEHALYYDQAAPSGLSDQVGQMLTPFPNEASKDAMLIPRLLSFGAIHPDQDDYKEALRNLKNSNIPGIKLHPVFQKTNADDIRYLRIIEEACSLGLLISIHAGYDISMPDAPYADCSHLSHMLQEVHPKKCILAHMGCWNGWEMAQDFLPTICGGNSAGDWDIYLDTSFVIAEKASRKTFYETHIPVMKDSKFCQMVRQIGSSHVLFGTDSPWTDQAESIAAINRLPLNEIEKDDILWHSGYRLLHQFL